MRSEDDQIGILAHLSKSDGIGGKIKEVPEDFVVEEITEDGRVLETNKEIGFEDEDGEYLHFTLQKKNWDTIRALKIVSKRLSVSHKRIKFAGTKDRRGITTQRASVWNVAKERLEKVNIKDIEILDISQGKEAISLGMLAGNRFTINIRDVSGDARERVQNIVEELDDITPNFFGSQRFGIRLTNHIIGRHILQGEFKGAVMEYLCGMGREPDDATAARKKLAETEDFKEALLTFPDYLGYEKSILNRLIKEPTDFIGALRNLPKKLRLMFVHSYQGYVFNRALSEYIKVGDIPDSIPLVGKGCDCDKIVADILEEEGMLEENFTVKSMPEMSLDTLQRKAKIPFSDFAVVDFNEKESNIWVRFCLPPGAYATVLLREIMK